MSPAAAAAARSGARLRRVLTVPRCSRRLRNRLAALLGVCLLLAAGYLLWFRDSSFVQVDQVTVTGATTDDADRLQAALVSAARDMTTLHLDRAKLERAAAAFPVVKSIEVTPDFPHRLAIEVIEHQPAALAITSRGSVPVAADGTLLAGLEVKGSLPELHASGSLDGARLEDPTAVSAARVAGAAPLALRRRLEEVSRESGGGLVAQVREGPQIIFGSAERLPAKWIAAARVLADPEAAGAAYIDVRLPERPAAGGVADGAAPTIDPATGQSIDPATGLPLDPTTGLPIDPATGLPIDPVTGQPIDPATGLPVGQATGAPTDPATGQAIDPATGQAIDPATGQPIDPATGAPAGTTTTPTAPTTTTPPATTAPDPSTVAVDPVTGVPQYTQP